MFFAALTLAVLTFVPISFQNGCLNGLLQAMNESCLDQLAHVIASLNGTTTGQVVLAQLSQGNNTIFAPTDDALSSVNPAIMNNESCLANIISYHVVSGNFFHQTQTYPNVTIGRTLLNDSTLVMLEGNRSQALAWSKLHNGSFFVINQGSNFTVVNTTRHNNTAILAIDSVLTIPPNISTVLSNPSYNLTTVAGVLYPTVIPNGPSVLQALSSAHGITVFTPNNAAVQAAQSSISGLSKNETAILNVLFNHIINGTTVYSPKMSTGTTFTSAGGQNFAFVANSSGRFVSVGGSNQVQIIEPDVLTSNGVIHVVDGVMLDTNSDAPAASSAFASATSVAASATLQPDPATSPSPPSQGRAVKGRANNWKLGVLAGMVASFVPLV